MDNWGAADISTNPAAVSRAEGNRQRRPLGEIRPDRLKEILRAEVLPRLLSGARRPANDERSQGFVHANPKALAFSLISGRIAQARALITTRLRSGATAANVMLEDLAPAARELEEFWRRDECDFFDVTIASQALRDMVRNLAPAPAPSALPHPQTASLIVSTAPGENHELGGDIVTAMFRFAGWRAVRCQGGDVCARLAREWFDAAAFSLSCDRHIESLRGVIQAAREVSRNRRLTILVGGPVFAARPELAGRLGADTCASMRDIGHGYPASIPRFKRL
jgi:MerR family transcriptional regulator, light-induced transcriptional regulator